MKAKLKILYDAGDARITIPGSFNVELRRWLSVSDVDYIIESGYVTNDLSGERSVFDKPFYKFVSRKYMLGSSAIDADALREVIAEHDRMIVLCDEIRGRMNDYDR